MSYWGKFFGGMAGFAMGGPFGMMIGAAIGHAADNGGTPDALRMGYMPQMDPLAQAARMARMMGNRDQIVSLATVVLAAKLAKSDGPVNRAEIDAFKRHFLIPPEAVRPIGRMFDLARDNEEGFETYAGMMGEACARDHGILETTLAALYAIARADGPLNRAEEEFLRRVAAAFGLGANGADRARQGAPLGPPTNEPDPYEVLGQPRNARDDDIRAAWKTLVRKNHPDRMSAEGGSQAEIDRATETVARINAAWDRIKRDRGL
jgi:DnaJ like chaperone protein